MAKTTPDEDAIRAVRDQLLAALAEIDRLELRMAGNEVNAAIEILNEQLGIETDPAEVRRMKKRYFFD